MFRTFQLRGWNKSWCFVFFVCIFSSSSDVIHYMIFWCVSNKMEQRKELIGLYVFMRMETILSNSMRNWRQRTADTWNNNNNKQITSWWQRQHSQSLVTVSCLDEQNVHVFTCKPYSPDYGLCDVFFFLVFFQVMKQKLVGRKFFKYAWSVNICHFRAHDFSLHHSTKRHVRRSWRLPSLSTWGWIKDERQPWKPLWTTLRQARATSWSTVAANKAVKQDASVQLPAFHVLP